MKSQYSVHKAAHTASLEPQKKTVNRWLMVIAASILMLCLGTVYAWSYFQAPLMHTYGWNNRQVSLIFSLAIFFLGVSAALGGILLPKVGPRKMALLGSIFFSTGYLAAGVALSVQSLALLYIGYGVIGGSGLGLCYVTPVTTVARWFPDKKGLATGMVIMGFGLGALFMSKLLAPALLDFTGGNLVSVFLFLGCIFFALTFVTSLSLQNPPEKAASPAAGAQAAALSGRASSPRAQSAGSALRSPQFILLWAMFFCNIAAGITIVGFQSPLLQDLLRKINPDLSASTLAHYGASLIAVTSLFNGLGRFFWGAVSDRIGRLASFRIMLGSEAIVFVALMLSSNPLVFSLLFCWILLCYGGGFGAMPATISEFYGPGLMTVMYGAVLTAWSAGGLIGPQLTAFIKDRVPDKARLLSFIAGAVFVAAGFVISLLLKPTRAQSNR